MGSEFLVIASVLGFSAPAFLNGFLCYLSLAGFRRGKWRVRLGILMLMAGVTLLLGVNFTLTGIIFLSGVAQGSVLRSFAVWWVVNLPLAGTLALIGYVLRRSGQPKLRKR